MVVLAFVEGVAWGCSEAIQVKLGGVCSTAPDATRLDDFPCLALTSGTALLLVAPVAALLVNRKIKNADVQLMALGVWLASAVLLLAVGWASPESFLPGHSKNSGAT